MLSGCIGIVFEIDVRGVLFDMVVCSRLRLDRESGFIGLFLGWKCVVVWVSFKLEFNIVNDVGGC